MDLPPVPCAVLAKFHRQLHRTTYVMTGEVSALEHEARDDAVESRLGSRRAVAEALLVRAEGAEVLSSTRDVVVVEVEEDAAGLLC